MTSTTAQGFLSVPDENAPSITPDNEALQPDPGTEADFQRENNPFEYTPGQLGKLINPKSLGAFHALGGLVGLEEGLKASRHTGISVDNAEDVEARTRIFADNRLPERKSKSIFELMWMAYNDKILILLTVAAVIALSLGTYQAVSEGSPEWIEGVAIIVAIVIVVMVGAVNDFQKEKQFAKLNKKKDDRQVKVCRSGNTQEINIYDLMVGDILLVEPGDVIPADGIFISGHGVKCDESSATGESDLLKKTPGDEALHAIEARESLKKIDPFMLSGGKVTEGIGRMLVTAVGVHSSHGKTMMALRESNDMTPLQAKLNNLAEYIAKIGGSAALLLFFVLLIKFCVGLKNDNSTSAEKGQEFIKIFIVAVTIIVVAVPEGLPLAVTLALAYATKRMLKDNNLVRVLRSCEIMGNATTVCSDKTGTLTQNVMTVVAGALGTTHRFSGRTEGNVLDVNVESKQMHDGVEDIPTAEMIPQLGDSVKLLWKDSIAINSTAFEAEQEGKQVYVGSKTETALLDFARDYLGMDRVSIERSNAEVVQILPFDSGRKSMAMVIKLRDGKGYRLIVKGASEIMLGHCTRIVSDPTRGIESKEMSGTEKETLEALIDEYASRSLRTIGFIYQDFESESWPPRGMARSEDDKTQAAFEKYPDGMVLLGIVGIQDPLRPGVTEAVKDCIMAGVVPRMVTGDNIITAKAIATECGIYTAGGLALEGQEFRKMSRSKQQAIIPNLQVLARSSPEDKRILVKRLKEMGQIVAVTGDGTNDAPALKAADVGFAMNISGTEVAKEASDIILMDDNFASIIKALMWGRAVNDAVRKFLQFQITVNITAVLLAFISAVSSDEEQSVLTAVQLLWINLIMDTMAALALATDPPNRKILNRKPDLKTASLFSVTMWKMIIGQAIYQLIITLILYFAGRSILSPIFAQDNPEKAEHQHATLVFNTFTWMQIFNALNNRRLDNNLNIFEGLTKNLFFVGIFFTMIAGQVLIIFVGSWEVFQAEPQNGAMWGCALVLGFLSLPVGVLIRMFPDRIATKMCPPFIKRWAQKKRDKRNAIVITDEENQDAFGMALLEIQDELAWLKKYRGGRINSLKFTIAHPKEALFSSSRSPSRSRASSTGAAMAGIVAGSIAGGWSPGGERREGGLSPVEPRQGGFSPAERKGPTQDGLK